MKVLVTMASVEVLIWYPGIALGMRPPLMGWRDIRSPRLIDVERLRPVNCDKHELGLVALNARSLPKEQRRGGRRGYVDLEGQNPSGPGLPEMVEPPEGMQIEHPGVYLGTDRKGTPIAIAIIDFALLAEAARCSSCIATFAVPCPFALLDLRMANSK